MRTICPFCGKDNPVAAPLPGKTNKPKNGDYSFCIGCGEWAIFDTHQSSNVRKPRFADYIKIVDDPRLAAVRQAWLQTR